MKNEENHNLLFYFNNNPEAKKYHKTFKLDIKESNEYLKNIKMIYKKYINCEIKLKSKEIIKKFYYGKIDLELYINNNNNKNIPSFVFKKKHTKPITNILFSKKIKGLFYTSSWDGKIFINNTNIPIIPYQSNVFNLENTTLKLFKGHLKGIYKIHENLDSIFSIFSVSFDNFIKQWDVNYNKLLSRNQFLYNLIDSIEVNNLIYLLTKNKSKIFLSNLDSRINNININNIQFNENYIKILNLNSNIFLLLNKKKKIHLFDIRNQKTINLDFKSINIFKGDDEIFFTQENNIDIIKNEDLCRNNKFNFEKIQSKELINNTAEIIKTYDDSIILKNKSGFFVYNKYHEKCDFLENNEFITDFDFQRNKLIYGDLDSLIYLYCFNNQ